MALRHYTRKFNYHETKINHTIHINKYCFAGSE